MLAVIPTQAATPVKPVKPQHRLRHFPTVAPSLWFFYSNKNHLVQLEDTTIKTERGYSMQRTKRTTVTHHRSYFIYHVRRVSRADWQEEWGETDCTLQHFDLGAVISSLLKTLPLPSIQPTWPALSGRGGVFKVLFHVGIKTSHDLAPRSRSKSNDLRYVLWSPVLNQMICDTRSDWSTSKQWIILRLNGLTDSEF